MKCQDWNFYQSFLPFVTNMLIRALNFRRVAVSSPIYTSTLLKYVGPGSLADNLDSLIHHDHDINTLILIHIAQKGIRKVFNTPEYKQSATSWVTVILMEFSATRLIIFLNRSAAPLKLPLSTISLFNPILQNRY
jgi:hypothetical protein